MVIVVNQIFEVKFTDWAAFLQRYEHIQLCSFPACSSKSCKVKRVFLCIVFVHCCHLFRSTMDSTTLEPFDPEAAGTFSDYAERLEFYFESVDLDLTSVFPSDPDYSAKIERLKSKRRAALLSNCGPKCFEVLKSLAAPASVKELSYEELKDLAVQHFDGESNPIKGRFEFCSRVRGSNERFSKFHQDLVELAKHCSFGKSLEERLRDQIVVGIRDEHLVAELISNKNLLYLDAVKLCSGLDAERKGEVNYSKIELC